MNSTQFRLRAVRKLSAAILASGLALPVLSTATAVAQTQTAPADDAPPPRPPQSIDINSQRLGAQELKGQTVEDVQIRGNTQVSTGVIRNQIRTRPNDKFDPATVSEDYQRVYGLRKFANVQALAERTPTGVNVVFIVTEQKQINAIQFRGNARVDEADLKSVVDLKIGEAIDSFRISLSRQAVENLYRDKNFPLAHVDVLEKPLIERGDLVFNVVEGPSSRIRRVGFKGAKNFSADKLKDQIKTASWLFIFRSGKYDPDQVEDDVAALRKFYESKGFFDARVGRKIIWSPDLSEIEVDFVIDEGVRYQVDKVQFVGNTGLSADVLRSRMKLLEGRPFDAELQQRDIREMVRVYSERFGYIFQPQSNDPDYLRVDAKPVFRRQAGHVELVYEIHEGREFTIGNIIVKGNTRSQDKLALREFRNFAAGQRFNSGELQDATERIRRTPFFSSVNVTPIGEEPGVRDILIEVTEQHTASFNVGAGVNSNGGIGGNITYEQRNFDIANLPSSFSDAFTDRAFTGAGQTFRASIEPGTIQSNASLRFSEPWLFDQPYGFSNELYLRTRVREHYDDRRIGDQVTLSHRFDYIWSGALALRGEQVKISGIDDPQFRAQQYLDERGKHVLSSVALTLRRDTTNPGIVPDRGSITTGRAEFYGALGGDYSFQKFSLGWDAYQTVAEDLLDRKTVLGLHANAGYISGDSVFFERFYGGGIGSIRGFRFRGVSPRGGRAEDPVGGDFSLTGTVELNFPVAGETLRGVVFTDFGTVEREVELTTLRASVGVGVRLVLPFLGQTPLALDLAYPISKSNQDDVQYFSFSFGFIQ